MKNDIKRLMEFVDRETAKNIKCGKRTKIELTYSFFGGKMNMHVRPENLVYDEDMIFVDSSLDDPSEFSLTVLITDEVKISIDENAKTFTIVNVGVTGILDKRIEGKLIREGYL